MTDPTSDDVRDDFILQERLSGKSARAISKQLRCTVGEVDAALDRVLPKLDNAARLRHISLDLNRLDRLLEVFYKRAIEDVDTQAGLLCVKILERKSAMLGLDSPQKLDIIQVQAQETTPRHEKIRHVIMNLCIGDGQQNNGNGQPLADDGAVDTLLDSDETKPSH